MQNTLLCRSELLERIPVSRTTLDKLLRLGVLPSPRTIGGRYFWPEAKVSAAIRALPLAHGVPCAVQDPPDSEYALPLSSTVRLRPLTIWRTNTWSGTPRSKRNHGAWMKNY